MKNPKLEIVFYTAGLEFDQDKAINGPLGGSETAVGLLAKELAARGHKVRVFCNTKARGPVDGERGQVEYCPLSYWGRMSTVLRPDVLIISRYTSGFHAPWPESGMTYFWMHDTMGKEYEQSIGNCMGQIDRVILNSKYHYHQVFKTAPGFRDFERGYASRGYSLISVQTLGIHDDLVPNIPDAKLRDKRKLIYSSRPERGLAPALDVLQKLNEKMPKDDHYKLHVFGYDVPSENIAPNIQRTYDYLKKVMAASPDVVVMQKRDRRTMYQDMATAQALLYPTDFPEIFCLTVLEAQACGLPVVTTNDYAIRETCPDAEFIKGFPEDDDFVDKTIDAIQRLEVESHWEEKRKQGLDNYEGKSWEDVAEDWEEMFYHDFKQRLQKEPLAVARALYHESDLIACERLLRNPKDYGVSFPADHEKMRVDLFSKVSEEISFLLTPEKYTQHYKDSDNGSSDETVIELRGKNARLQHMIKMMKDMKLGETPKILDWGCNLGFMAFAIKEIWPKAEVVAYDVDPKLIKKGKAVRDKEWGKIHGDKGPEDCGIEFTSEEPAQDKMFDVVVCAELLEHLPNHATFLNEKIIPRLKHDGAKGGAIVITVPHGAWEAESFEKDPKRYHVRRFHNKDLEDIALACSEGEEDLAGYLSQVIPAGVGREQNNLGWLIVAFNPNGNPCPEFEYDRHILTQRPRQSVSCCIITKDRPWQLQRMIGTVAPWVDQFVIADTGTTDPWALKIMKEHATDLIKAPDPLEVGFGPSRNVSVMPAWGDWILWIDSDEWLDHPEALRKYLRVNAFQGYVLRQQNLTLDGAHSDPDNPIRLYRRKCGAKFIGLIHEQAEMDFDDPIKPAFVLADLSILHDSYYKEPLRIERFERNLPLLIRETKELPKRVMTKCLMMRDLVQMGNAQIARGNKAAGAANIQKAIATYEQYFEPKLFEAKYFTHAFQFYQEAVRILGSGFACTFGMICSPEPLNPQDINNVELKTLVFRTAAEAERYIMEATKVTLKEGHRRKHGEEVYHSRPGDRRLAKGPAKGNKV